MHQLDPPLVCHGLIKHDEARTDGRKLQKLSTMTVRWFDRLGCEVTTASQHHLHWKQRCTKHGHSITLFISHRQSCMIRASHVHSTWCHTGRVELQLPSSGGRPHSCDSFYFGQHQWKFVYLVFYDFAFERKVDGPLLSWGPRALLSWKPNLLQTSSYETTCPTACQRWSPLSIYEHL